ncbi:MAG: spondin domain-containing protein [Thiomicrorhabdus sp.]|nr:spondin domain-containing protein [Thiomicrorhabdus sp.]
MAAEHDITVNLTNLTNAIYFTPVVAAAHNDSAYIFRSGMAASQNLQALAEGGSIAGVSTDLQASGANVVENPAEGLLAPGASTMFQFIKDDNNKYFSIASMMLPTNDGFVGADSIKLPTTPGTYTYLLNAYDAGTEANDEIINGGGALGAAGIPKDPGAADGVSDNSGGTGVATADDNTSVHIHRGVQGDNDATGGTSDLTNHVHRWLNPVAKLVITVK